MADNNDDRKASVCLGDLFAFGHMDGQAQVKTFQNKEEMRREEEHGAKSFGEKKRKQKKDITKMNQHEI